MSNDMMASRHYSSVGVEIRRCTGNSTIPKRCEKCPQIPFGANSIVAIANLPRRLRQLVSHPARRAGNRDYAVCAERDLGALFAALRYRAVPGAAAYLDAVKACRRCPTDLILRACERISRGVGRPQNVEYSTPKWGSRESKFPPGDLSRNVILPCHPKFDS